MQTWRTVISLEIQSVGFYPGITIELSQNNSAAIALLIVLAVIFVMLSLLWKLSAKTMQ